MSGYNTKYLVYHFSSKCNVQVLLNDTINDGKPFKILLIITIVSKTDLNRFGEYNGTLFHTNHVISIYGFFRGKITAISISFL